MTLAAFLVVCAGGAALGQMTGTFRRLGPLATLAGLAAACATALLIGPTDGVTVGDVRLSGSTYASAFLAVAVAACLLLWLVRLGSGGGSDRLAPATMAVFGGLGIALTAADARVALTAVAAAAVAGTAVSVGGGNASEDSDNRLSEARTMALLVASLLFASIAVSRPAWTDQDGPVFVLGLLGLAAALAVRSGSVPVPRAGSPAGQERTLDGTRASARLDPRRPRSRCLELEHDHVRSPQRRAGRHGNRNPGRGSGDAHPRRRRGLAPRRSHGDRRLLGSRRLGISSCSPWRRAMRAPPSPLGCGSWRSSRPRRVSSPGRLRPPTPSDPRTSASCTVG